MLSLFLSRRFRAGLWKWLHSIVLDRDFLESLCNRWARAAAAGRQGLRTAEGRAQHPHRTFSIFTIVWKDAVVYNAYSSPNYNILMVSTAEMQLIAFGKGNSGSPEHRLWHTLWEQAIHTTQQKAAIAHYSRKHPSAVQHMWLLYFRQLLPKLLVTLWNNLFWNPVSIARNIPKPF